MADLQLLHDTTDQMSLDQRREFDSFLIGVLTEPLSDRQLKKAIALAVDCQRLVAKELGDRRG